jgi:hypothetical protein
LLLLLLCRSRGREAGPAGEVPPLEARPSSGEGEVRSCCLLPQMDDPSDAPCFPHAHQHQPTSQLTAGGALPVLIIVPFVCLAFSFLAFALSPSSPSQCLSLCYSYRCHGTRLGAGPLLFVLPSFLPPPLSWPLLPPRLALGPTLERGANQGSIRQARSMATEDPLSKQQREEELAVEQEPEEIEPITSLTDLPASVLMRIHELILGDEVVGARRSLPGPSNHHSVSATACWPSSMQGSSVACR